MPGTRGPRESVNVRENITSVRGVGDRGVNGRYRDAGSGYGYGFFGKSSRRKRRGD